MMCSIYLWSLKWKTNWKGGGWEKKDLGMQMKKTKNNNGKFRINKI